MSTEVDLWVKQGKQNLGQLSKCSDVQEMSYTTEFYLFYGVSAGFEATDLLTYYLFRSLLNLLIH